jgi:hypothetical protein
MIKRSKYWIAGLSVAVVAIFAWWIISIFNVNVRVIGNISPKDLHQIKAAVNEYTTDRFLGHTKTFSFGRILTYIKYCRDHPIIQIEMQADNAVHVSLQETFRGDGGFLLKQEGGKWKVVATFFR